MCIVMLITIILLFLLSWFFMTGNAGAKAIIWVTISLLFLCCAALYFIELLGVFLLFSSVGCFIFGRLGKLGNWGESTSFNLMSLISLAVGFWMTIVSAEKIIVQDALQEFNMRIEEDKRRKKCPSPPILPQTAYR
ncbi:Uncharacterised protein [Serratia rubidaea]|uniref:Uncharacterized protein n=1 Tax=Serratia rubidaea TaxID=61652 RepID=A0A447QIV2_SERRU|nr:Uncharacterised protein [Serratia rubidaea]